jgi:hypothetical protein
MIVVDPLPGNPTRLDFSTSTISRPFIRQKLLSWMGLRAILPSLTLKTLSAPQDSKLIHLGR